MGKRSTYTQEAADEIIRRLSAGEPLEWILEDDHMPGGSSTVSDWRAAHKDFNDKFLKARDSGYDALAAGALRIAETPEVGVIEKLERVTIPDPNDPDKTTTELRVVEVRREDMLGHRKFKFEARMKLLSKWDPRRYGDKVQLADADGNVLQIPQFIVAPIQPLPPPADDDKPGDDGVPTTGEGYQAARQRSHGAPDSEA